LASGRQYGNALLGIRHQEEEEDLNVIETTRYSINRRCHIVD